MIEKNKVVKIVGDIFTVLKKDSLVSACCLKNIKKNRVVVGDDVELKKDEYSVDKYIITKVFPRKNCIPRPVVANIDKLLILVAIEPKPDFYLIDKLYIYSVTNNIEPIIVINKSDISDKSFVDNIKSQYGFIKTFVISAKCKSGIDELKKYILKSVCAVCGQSAVGKSSLINALIPDVYQSTQGLSEKISRGKHTTRVNELFVWNNLCIADTPGFSNLDLNIDFDEVQEYYPEFQKYRENCKYLDCSHVGEGKDCGVIKAKDMGKINKDRYLRYVDLYNKLKENWEKKYD